MIFLIIPRILGVLIIAYSFAISLRIILSWFRNLAGDSLYDGLYRITEPYLSLFRNFKFVRMGGLDFSPIIALAVLFVLSDILIRISYLGHIKFFMILGILLQALSSVGFWIFVMLLLVSLIRFLGIVLKKNQQLPFWSHIDALLYAPISLVLRLFPRKPPYSQLLLTLILALLVLLIGGYLLVDLLYFLIQLIPF